ncbi:MAG: hypothetical protein ABI579_08880, partial [Candidatus Sumerlaeota bacterium]
LPGMINQHMNTALPIPVAWRKMCNGRLVALMEKMCAKKRENRPYTWDEVVRELDALQALASGNASLADQQAESRTRFAWVLGVVAALALLSIILIGIIASQKKGGSAHEDKNAMAVSLTPTNPVEQNAQNTATLILQNNSSREEPFILPAPQQPAGRRGEDSRSPDDNEPPPPDGSAPLQDVGEGRPRQMGEGRRPPQLSDEQIKEHIDARQRAIAEAKNGDFQKTRSILNDEVVGGGGRPPAPRPVQRVYEAFVELMEETDLVDAKIKKRLNNPNATAAQRIAETHRMIIAEGAKISNEQAWFTYVYLYILRDPAIAQDYSELAKTRPNFGQDDRQKATLHVIDNFFDPAVGFPPTSGQPRMPQRPQ